MNFLTIAQNIIDRQDGERPTSIYSANLSNLDQGIRRIREHINLAYNMVLLGLNRTNENRQATATITTVAGTESYTIPIGILNIDQLVVGNDPPIPILPWPEYERFKADTLAIVTTGYPTHCSIYTRKVFFYPTPDSALTVYVRGQESMTELNQDEDEPDLPADYHRVIQELALALEMAYEGNPAAGTLVVNENGSLSGQGGQAGLAVGLFNMVRRNSGDHMARAPRIISRSEMGRINAIRQVIRG